MDILYWLIEVGTNNAVMGFLDNNSIILLGGWGILVMFLRYRAKKTPSPDDDELINAIDEKVNGLFHSKIQNKARL